jgi:hypothetical protein
MTIIINPGTGPVEGATEENARANMDAFCADLRENDIIATTISRFPDLDSAGRFGYRLGTGDARVLEVEMPGLPLDQVRYVDSDTQSIWDFPRLYVDGDSWVWMFALSACEAPAEYVRPTVAELGHGDPNADHPNPDKCGNPSCDC